MDTMPLLNKQDESYENELKYLSSLCKKDFQKKLSNYNKLQVKKFYIQVLTNIENAILLGSVNKVKRWSKFIEFMIDCKEKFIETIISETKENSNLIILACKYNRTEILKFLFDIKSNILSILFNDLYVLPTAEDDECHNSFYYAIRSSNVELLETLINEWPNDYFASRPEDLEEILAKAYEELKLKNVLLSDEMEYFVENKLINIRFFSNNSEDYKPSIDKLIERIDFVLEIVNLLQREFSNEDVDQRFLFIARTIAQNIHVLKRQLKSTYNKLPWEEIEFCLIAFVYSYIKQQEINLFYSFILNKSRILYHLQNFAAKLQKERENIKSTDIDQLSNLPNLKREDIVAGIVNESSEFEGIYLDYEQIRDIHSLQKITDCIDISLSTDCNEKEGQLIKIRTIQIIGEHLKCTLESPKLSKFISELLILSTPDETRKILIDLRNSLSHFYTLATDENSDNVLYSTINSDLQKINLVIKDILYSRKVKIIQLILIKIIDSKQFEEIKEVAYILSTVGKETIMETGVDSDNKNGYKKIQEIVRELKEKLPDKTNYEKELFDNLEKLFLPYKNSESNYFKGFLSLQNLCLTFSLFSIDHNFVRTAKEIAKDTLKYFPTVLPENVLQQIQLMLTKIIMVVLPRLKFDVFDPKLWGLFYSILYYTNIDPNQIKGFEEILNLLGQKSKKTKKKRSNEKSIINIEKEIATKILMMEGILNKIFAIKNTGNLSKIESFFSIVANIDDGFKNADKLRKNQEKIRISKMNRNMYVALEVLVLEILSLLEKSKVYFLNNNLFIDDYSPLLNGKYLRNHLAHGNTITEIMLNDPSNALLANANMYVSTNVENCNGIGKLIEDDPFRVKEIFYKNLDLLTNQKYMFVALEEGNLDELNNCLERGADINSRDLNLWTALHFAAKGPNIDAVKFVLKHCSNLNEKNRDGEIPLHIAATYGRSQTIDYFINEVNYSVNAFNGYGNTALHIVSFKGHIDSAKVLLKCDADILRINISGCSPLHLASQENHKTVVELLLKKGINVNHENKGGFTALHISSENGHIEVVNFLLANKANVNARTDREGIPLHTAALNGHLDVIKTLISNGSDKNAKTFDGRTALHSAIENGHEAIAKILVDHGADVNASDHTYKNTPLHYAVCNGFEKIVQFLLHNGANVNLLTINNLSPLHVAVNAGHLGIVELLMPYIDLNNFEYKHRIPILHISALNNHKQIVDILIREGIDIDRKDEHGDTALNIASAKGHSDVVEILITNGADINSPNVDGVSPLHSSILNDNKDVIMYLIKNGADIHATDNKNKTLLHFAAMSGCVIEEKNIFLNGVNINATDEYDLTPLHLAAFYGNNNLVEYLIKNGAIVNYKNKNGITALHLAVQNNQKESTAILIQHGADINVKDNSKHTSLYFAVKNKNSEIVELLIKSGADVNVECNPFSLAAFSGYKSIFKIFLNNSDISMNILNEALITAAINGNNILLKHLISKGVDVNTTLEGVTPLYLSACHGHVDAADILIRNGAKVNCIVFENMTPLHIAATQGHGEVTEILIRNKANVCAKDYKNRTPLELAVIHCHLRIVQLLVQHEDIDINAKGNHGFTLLHISAQVGCLDIAKCLIENGSDINAINSLGSKPVHIAAREGHLNVLKYFINKGNNINDIGAAGFTLLHYAASKKRLDVINYLLNLNINVNSIDYNLKFPIYYAANTGCLETVRLLINNGAYFDMITKDCLRDATIKEQSPIPINQSLIATEKLFQAIKDNISSEVERLLKEGAFVNAINTSKVSPMHLASWKGAEKVIDILIKNKANPNIVGKGGSSPLHYASKFNHYKIVCTLLSNGAIYDIKNDNNKVPLDFASTNKIKRLLTLISESFENIQNGNSNVIDVLKNVKDTDTIKAIANACNSENKSLIVVATLCDFPKKRS